MAEIPERSTGDVALALTKASISMIPIAGGPAAELFQLLVQPPLEKRRTEWMQSVGEKLQELELTGLKLDDLQNNEQFISAVMHATHVAVRTHVKSKREALRNAIINIAVGQAPDEVMQHLLLACIEDLSEFHLRILKVLDQPINIRALEERGMKGLIEAEIPDLRNRSDIYEPLH